MSRTIFISCGQFTHAERELGAEIARLVRDAGLQPFFAQTVHNLNGLDENILKALRDCVGFIAVLHPRGRIERPDGRTFTRASIWIEQEIAIATYIQRIEPRPIEIIAFKHADVGLEGLRSLIQLNPIEFTDDSEILEALAELLRPWKTLQATGIKVRLESAQHGLQDGHPIRTLSVDLINNSGNRIPVYDAQICLPANILKHWSAVHTMEHKSEDSNRRCFRFSHLHYGPVSPNEKRRLFETQYCVACGVADVGGSGLETLVTESKVDVTVWIDGRSYSDEATIRELAERKDSGQRARSAS